MKPHISPPILGNSLPSLLSTPQPEACNSNLQFPESSYLLPNYPQPRPTKSSSLLPANVPALRRTQTDGPSTNYGPHETNIGNKLDPTVDSDLDHRGPGRHYPEGPGSGTTYKCNNCGSTSFGLYSNSNGDRISSPNDLNSSYTQPSSYDRDVAPYKSQESSNYGPHRTNVANKLDPRYDSDLDHRGPGDHGARPTGEYAEHPGGEHSQHTEREYPHPPDWNKEPGFQHPYKHDHDRRHPEVMHNPAEQGSGHPEPGHGVRYDGQPGSEASQKPVWTNPLLNRLDPRVDSETGMRKY